MLWTGFVSPRSQQTSRCTAYRATQQDIVINTQRQTDHQAHAGLVQPRRDYHRPMSARRPGSPAGQGRVGVKWTAELQFCQTVAKES